MIQSRPDDDTPKRPRSHWIGFGLVAIITLWVPLAAIAEWAKRRAVVSYLGDRSGEDQMQLAVMSLSDRDHARLSAVIVVVPMIALALACVGGGYLIGKFSGDAGIREGALAAATAALFAILLTSVTSEIYWGSFLSIAVAVPFGALGARIGLRARAPV